MKNFVLLFFGMAMALSACAKKDYLITIKTSYGDIKVILYDQTPRHKENFLSLARSGDYDSTIFHRVINNFMIQGGDVNAKPGNEKKIGYTIPAELVDTLFHHKGALAAARMPDNVNPQKASSGCQWYIVQGNVYSEEELTTDMEQVSQSLRNLMQKPEYAGLQEELFRIYSEEGQEAYGKKIMELVPLMEKELGVSFKKEFPQERLKVYTTIGGAPHLDDAYTVFGRVVEGLDVVDKIAAVQTGMKDKPVENIYMTVEVTEMNVKKLNKLYSNK